MTQDAQPHQPAQAPAPATGTECPPQQRARYCPPSVSAVGKLDQLTRGNGSTWVDYLGDTSTRYG